MNIHASPFVFLIACATLFSIVFSCPSLADGASPEAAIKTLKLAPEQSVSTYIPSDAAPGQGLAVNLIYPEKPRYTDGAPVAVVVPGQNGADGLSFTMHAAQVGFIEVRLAFPGGGPTGFRSGGIYDYRGSSSQLAFKDVLLFAAGKTADTKGRHISELVPVKVAKTNVGIVGWSNGGNLGLITLAKYPSDLQSVVSWIAFYESPIGSLFYPPNLGGIKDIIPNPNYRQGSCATGHCLVNWKTLKWSKESMRNKGEHRKVGEPEIPGILYFDENDNGVWDESKEYALNYLLDVGLDKQIYPPQPLRALDTMKRFYRWVEVTDKKPKNADGSQPPPPPPKPSNRFTNKKRKLREVTEWPEQLATIAESEAYYDDRDGSLYIDKVASQYPNLLIIVFATQVDHLQLQADHPHIAFQYNAWLQSKAHWVKLNPESVYIATVANMNAGNFTNNKPNITIDSSDINQYLEPEGTTRDYIQMEATVAELADRRRSKNLGSPLIEVLTTYYNSANPAPLPPAPPPKKEQ